jgi:hypothetical protein
MPRLLRKPSQRSSPPVPEPALVSVEDLPSIRRPYGSGNTLSGVQGLIATPSGVYSQVIGSRSSRLEEEEDLEGGLGEEDFGMEVDYDMGGGSDRDEEEVVRRAGKKQRQWRNWSAHVIPMLLEPYLELLRESEGLRDLTSMQDRLGCKGCADGRSLEVVCIYFESVWCVELLDHCILLILVTELEQITLCTCTEPALQLLSMGLFPCAPALLSLAVDLQMLNFARELFVNAAPNLTAWCETLEGFLSARQFKLTTRVGNLCTVHVHFGRLKLFVEQLAWALW